MHALRKVLGVPLACITPTVDVEGALERHSVVRVYNKTNKRMISYKYGDPIKASLLSAKSHVMTRREQDNTSSSQPHIAYDPIESVCFQRTSTKQAQVEA